MADQKFCALSVRKIRPGSWDAFRAAWDAREHGGEIPSFVKHVYHLQSMKDPNMVISFGISEGDPEEMRAMMQTPERQQLETKRQAAMAEHVVETIVDDIFEVTEEIVPAGVR